MSPLHDLPVREHSRRLKLPAPFERPYFWFITPTTKEHYISAKKAACKEGEDGEIGRDGNKSSLHESTNVTRNNAMITIN